MCPMQPAISRRVHLLKRELDAPLFERVHTGVVLTDAGRAFLPHAESLRATMRDGIDVRLRTALSAEVSALVRRGDATLGLRYEADLHADLVSTTVYDEQMLPICSAHHPLARTRRVDAAALAGERWITFPPRPGAVREPYASALEHRLAACGLSAAEIIPIDSLTAQKRMVEAGSERCSNYSLPGRPFEK